MCICPYNILGSKFEKASIDGRMGFNFNFKINVHLLSFATSGQCRLDNVSFLMLFIQAI